MPPPFPLELWILVVKYAVAQPWHKFNFLPPINDLRSVQGFAEASVEFGDIVQAFRNEVLIIAQAFFPDVSDSMAQLVRHLRVTTFPCANDSVSSAWTSSSGLTFFDNLSRFSGVSSLSLSPPGSLKNPFLLLVRLQDLPFYQTLRVLDIRTRLLHSSSMKNLLDKMYALPVAYLPNLMQLRFFCKTPEKDLDWCHESLITGLASLLAGLPRLELLSLHTCLDDPAELADLRSEHYSSIAHLEPSEGYERDFLACPLCKEAYDHTKVVRRENVATRILAQKLPNLMEVRWADIWIEDQEDERCQRGTTISREGGKLVLLRDDNREE